ncbi:MAG TPA: DinB family protein [Actinomadura sp.]|jgi:uncharacterized damage-inducible protein DinB|nr:DinB family protein [Actinomadura sp.]
MATSDNTVTAKTMTGECDDILRILAEQRDTLRITVRGLDDEQAARRTTASELTLGGLIKHVCAVERSWVQIMTEGPDQPDWSTMDGSDLRMRDDETLAGLLEEYEAAAQETDKAVAALSDLDHKVTLPEAPWWPAPERLSWSVRHILLHIIRETAQHAGHADIIRESLDGANTTMQMGADAGMEF